MLSIQKIKIGADPGIENENPMDLSDDDTDVNSEAYKFDLQETLKKDI